MAKQKTHFRDTKEPRVFPPEPNEDLAYFRTTDVGRWKDDPVWRKKYADLYGQAALDKVDLSSIREVVIAGSVCPPEIAKALEERMPSGRAGNRISGRR